ncbi:UDP-glucose--hexose-1-phosphate uridylyltransferase [Pontibacillus yanchengensis]|uniref:UDP-glucose--hexose-1-phosphate uridylyltransferase n=2 Tax=Pontibacillus yanchengensis TaxID=462910 RepID=A0ACC7VD63_9BACI|nr:UDP-glucose--hexose-1-phosphate uridylyltransferase [Pontibacillus yanchengensis]MYL32142.1 UDP-glucose--hexose-1-phosphate uridylyltransferase [Pontibacillus yanchengensis]MYL52722.1 UDP-glucose--hexose-1-phosphate uridylyltransferase [Pontibacillus yanchengensis]
MNNIYHDIDLLIQYGVNQQLIEKWDVDYVRNQLLSLFRLENYQPTEMPPSCKPIMDLVSVLSRLLDYASDKGLIEDDTITERDLFDAKIMNKLIPFPSQVIHQFNHFYNTKGPVTATDYFYHLSKASYYIKTDRIAKNMHWYSSTEYGDLEITINLSKPEKDPKAIAAARAKKEEIKYPRCLLCKENEGYAGRLDHPARDNHRLIPVELEEEQWYLQYSPYVYYNEHAILLSEQHRPMEVSKEGFDRLLHFSSKFPHYFIGSNADLPIVGGSILSHDHFQGGHHEFPMAKAPIRNEITIPGYEDIESGIVHWPMSVLRLKGSDRKRISELGGELLNSWRNYSDRDVGIYAETNGECHNTITPIVRCRDGKYELDLVLRNNRTSEEHPMGIFHPHDSVHHIKKENIGLIEVMGLAVLPGRLIEEMKELAHYMESDNLDGAMANENTAKHVPWAREILAKKDCSTTNIQEVLQDEIGKRFSEVLEHAGVFKQTLEGQEAFLAFIQQACIEVANHD